MAWEEVPNTPPQWQALGSIRGPQGPQGPPGDPGDIDDLEIPDLTITFENALA